MTPLNQVLRHLRCAVRRGGEDLTDGQLLERFVRHRDPAALDPLVRRHGPMVWGVCRRILGSRHDAEDAFQATFLVLVRKAASVEPKERVGNWLYGVARQTARKARATAARRLARERPVAVVPEPVPKAAASSADWPAALDEALARLPDQYRAALVLCDLEGVPRKAAARQLGVPEGTLAGRLNRGRALLARRLARYGLAVPGGALAAVLGRADAAAGVPASLVEAAIRAAQMVAADKAATTGAIAAPVAALMEGVVRAMRMNRIRAAVVVLAVAGVLGGGAGLAWLAPAQGRPAGPVGGAAVATDPGPDVSGTWRGDGWGTVVLRPAGPGAFEGTYTDTFGKAQGRLAVRWSGASGRYEGTWGEGTYRFGRIALEPAPGGGAIGGAWTTDPACEHQPGVPGLAGLRWVRAGAGAAPQDPAPRPRPAAEGDTAWGPAIGGLQAGLGYRTGGRRPYRPGETVPLAVRVRNVGGAAVRFEYLPQFLRERPPAVTDGQGQPIPLPGLTCYGIHQPVAVTLAPGEAVELHELTLKLRPPGGGGADGIVAARGPEKFTVQYERVIGNSSSGILPNPDPRLGQLATGKLDLEVTEMPTPGPGPLRIRHRATIDTVQGEVRTITASSRIIGEFDGVFKPLRLEHLAVSPAARIRSNGQAIALTDLRPGTAVTLELEVTELAWVVVGIEATP